MSPSFLVQILVEVNNALERESALAWNLVILGCKKGKLKKVKAVYTEVKKVKNNVFIHNKCNCCFNFLLT